MERSNIEIKIEESICRIKKLKNIIHFSNNFNERNYYVEILKHEARELRNLKDKLNMYEAFQPSDPGKEFTIEELALYDGSNEKPAYIAVSGIVYDVSLEPSWAGGTHFNLYAGRNLTSQFMGCHGSIEILKNLPKVGILKS